MNYSARSILGEAAYLKRSCEILLDQLKSIEVLVSGDEELSGPQEDAIDHANDRWVSGAKDHLELAGNHLQGWKDDLLNMLTLGQTKIYLRD